MGEMGDIWRDQRADIKRVKRIRKETSMQLLDENGIKYVLKNNDHHVIISHGEMMIDFWPSTGLYIFRPPNNKTSSGIKNLLTDLQINNDQGGLSQ